MRKMEYFAIRVVIAAILPLLFHSDVVYAQNTNAEAAPESTIEPYPIQWAKIDFRPIIDNDRLFNKYKSCVLADNPVGCPKNALQLKKTVPEAINNLCARCQPEHVSRLKEAVEYICKKRRSVFDEVLASKDPKGEIRAKLEEKFGKIDC